MIQADIQLREANPADLDAILELDRVSFSQPWTRRSFEQAFGDRERAVIIIAERSPCVPDAAWGIAGFGVAWNAVDEGEIATLAVAQAARRRGVGRLIVQGLVQRLEARGARRIFLEVRHSNQAARTLYEKLGFAQVGLRENYYADHEAALVMKLDMPPC